MKTQRQLDAESTAMKILAGLAFGLLIAMLFTGCTTAIIDAKKPVLNPKTGELAGEETARARVYVTGNGTQVIDKLRASNGKTLSIGASGIDQTSESDKLLDSLGTVLLRGLLASAGAPAANIASAATTAAAASTTTPAATPAVDKTGFPSWWPDAFFTPNTLQWATNSLGDLRSCSTDGGCRFYPAPGRTFQDVFNLSGDAAKFNSIK